MLSSVEALAILLLTLLLVIFRPFRIDEGKAAVLGALLTLLAGLVSPGQLVEALVDKLGLFLFFLGLMTVAAVAESAGFFGWTAAQAGRLAGGDTRRLYLNTFLLGVLIATFLTNDAAALILTPVIYSLVVRLRVNPLPFMFACTFIADTASFTLPVANPINMLMLNAFPADLLHFLARLLPAALVAIALNLLLFFRLFRHDLPPRFDVSLLESPAEAIPDRAFFRYVAVVLAAIAAGYVVASALLLPLALVATLGALLLVAGAIRYRAFSARRLAREISWSLFLFIGGMAVVVKGVEQAGLTERLARLILDLSDGNRLVAVLVVVFGVALGANLINNVPMILVMISALREMTAAPPPLHDMLVYASIFGADLGPNLTTMGSLATVLWLVILRRKGLNISSVQYLKLGLVTTPLMLLAGALAIWLSAWLGG